MSEPSTRDEQGDESHYHYRISLHVRHPSADPERITEAIGTQPRGSWKAGEPRRTPSGTPLIGAYRDTYWYVVVIAGRYPTRSLADAVDDVLARLVRYREFWHQMRSEGGSAQLSEGWFFDRQSGDVLRYETLALAGDLQLDVSFDVYPPSQPQYEYTVADDVLPTT